MENALTRTNRNILAITILVYNLIVLIYTGNFYDKTKDLLMQGIDEKLVLGARMAAYLLPKDFHDRATGPGAISPEEDQRNTTLLTEFANQTGFRYVYSLIQEGDQCFFTSSNVTEEDQKSQKIPFYYQSFEEASVYTKKAFLNDHPVFQSSSDRWGTFRTALIPLRSPGGKVYLAGADYDIQYVNSLLKKQLKESISLACLLLLIPGPFVLLYLRNQKKSFSRLESDNLALSKNIEEGISNKEKHYYYEELFHNYFEEGLLGMAITSQDKGWIECNQQLCTMLGYDREELVKMTWVELTHPEDLPKDIELFNRLIAGETDEYVMEKRYIHKDGGIVHALLYIRILRHEDGAIKYIFTHVQDITERKKIEAALIESQEKYREVFNAVNEAIFLHDFETGQILDVNQTMLDMYGYTYQEALIIWPQGTCSGKSPYSQAEAVAWLEKSKNEGPQIFEWHAKRKNGELFWVEVNLKTAVINDIKCMISVVRDITDRKKTIENLKASEGLYRALTENSWDMTAIILRDGAYRYASPSIKKFLGYDPEKIIGQKMGSLCHPDDIPHLIRSIANAEQHPGVSLPSYSFRIRHKNGEYIHVDGYMTCLYDIPGINGIVCNGRDVTEQRKVEEELLKAKKLESIGILAGGIAHDFNNLLTTITGNISLAKVFAESNRKVAERLTEAEKASSRAKDLTQQLLTFSKGGEPVKETSSLVELVKETALLVLSGSNVRCEFDFANDLWLVDIDKGQISQAIQNLVINADQATPQGGILRISAMNSRIKSLINAPDMTLSAGDYVQLTIEDQGTGIPEENLDKIFDPYFTTKEKGSGLGLATVYSIIHKHDGIVTVQSQIGKGTAFTIYLPASRREAALQNIPIEENPLQPIHAKILVLDDEEFVREVVCEMLITLGCEVLCAEEGKEALRIYQHHLSTDTPFDFVILDLTIPGGMGGKETFEEMRKIDPKVKAIVSSGYSVDPVMANYQNYGFCGVMSKPFNFDEMNNILLNVLSK